MPQEHSVFRAYEVVLFAWLFHPVDISQFESEVAMRWRMIPLQIVVYYSNHFVFWRQWFHLTVQLLILTINWIHNVRLLVHGIHGYFDFIQDLTNKAAS